MRSLLWLGYPPQDKTLGWPGYACSWVSTLPIAYPTEAAASRSRRIVYIVDDGASLPAFAAAQQARGEGLIVSIGRLAMPVLGNTISLDLGEGFRALVRIDEPASPEFRREIPADMEIPLTEASTVIDRSLALMREPATVPPRVENGERPQDDTGAWKPDATYPEMKAPTLEFRLLAVVRLWNVIHHFYPYLRLIGNWDAVLPEFLAEMEGATTARDYALTIRRMAMRVVDGHTTVRGHPDLDSIYGDGEIGGVPVALQRIEGQPVVGEVSESAREAGLGVGDVLLSIDGRPVAERIEELRPYGNGSSVAERDWALLTQLLSGPSGSSVRLRVRGESGEKEVTLSRRKQDRPYWPKRHPADGEKLRMLPGGIGYVDLSRLEESDIDEVIRRFQNSPALILDLRLSIGHGAQSLATWLNAKGAREGPLFERPVVAASGQGELETRLSSRLPLDDPARTPYRGRVVVLIGERVQSASEQAGLLYEAGAEVVFVGSATGGANGDISSTTLPGGIVVTFSGQEVRHADGRPLQHIGLVPQVPVAPTIAGLRAGRDEVLERALRYLADPR